MSSRGASGSLRNIYEMNSHSCCQNGAKHLHLFICLFDLLKKIFKLQKGLKAGLSLPPTPRSLQTVNAPLQALAYRPGPISHHLLRNKCPQT
jgi:hypothetical protein